MQTLLGSNLSFLSVPNLPVDLSIEEAHLLIPEGFESILIVSKSDGDLKLELKNDEYKDNVITIPSSLFNPSKSKVSYPSFLILQKDKKIDYFNDLTNRYIFNQNEMMYIVLQHRLSLFLGKNVAYSYLLKRDITAVKSFVQHIKAQAYNAVSKNDNSFITMDIFNDDLSIKGLLGDLIHYRSFVPSVKLFMTIKSFLPIQFSSESNVGKLGKLIMRPYDQGSLFRSPGHKLFQDPQGNWTLKSLFKSAQNVVARNKTHVTANAYKRYNFIPTSNFIEDWVYDSKNYSTDDPILEGYKPKDHCYRRALVMIVPMNHDTKRFLFGEAEVSQDYYDDWIWEDLKVLECFESMDIPTDGTIVFAKPQIVDKFSGEVIKYENFVKVGTKFEAGKVEDIIIRDVKGVQFVKSKATNGPLGKERVTFRVIRRPGNARCDSNTGFKAVTKGKPYLGKLVLDNGQEHKFDMAFGMNSFKAKQNGIVCARAALAVDLNMYQPTHWSGLLNTQDEEEMQNASDSLKGYKVYDENGNQLTDVQVGVIYYRYTEPCKIFKSYRLQTLSHEAARNMHRNDNQDLFKFIHENYINSEMKEAMIEFQRVLTMSDIFEGDENLPYFTVRDVLKNKLFNRDELFTKTLKSSRANIKYLNPEFNPKGFFLDFRSNKGPLIRVPSASILSLFESELDTGEWMYHQLFVALNKIIAAILDNKVGYIYDVNPKSKRTTLASRYFQDIKGVIFTSDDKAEMNITCFTRPNVPGFAMKQVCEPLLPPGTALIMCQKTYDKALKNCYGEDYHYHSLLNSFYGLHVRNPSLWRTQLSKVKIWGPEDFRVHLFCVHNISLEKYLLSKENNDVVMFDPTVFAAQHSDSDGDHSAVMIPHGVEGQRLMREFVLSNVCEQEKAWTQKYVKEEFEADDSLIDLTTRKLLKPIYKLYDVPLHSYKQGRVEVPGYSTYLFQATEAKAAIGSSTNDGWVFAMILEVYQKYAQQNSYQYKDPNNPDGQLIDMVNLTDEKFALYHFTYIRGLQDFVVTGVKHNDTGSADFEVLFLKNIAQENNLAQVRKILSQNLELDSRSISDIIRIVTWAEITGIRKACSMFLKMYNKGTVPTNDSDKSILDTHQDYVQQNTYFGELLKPIFDVVNQSRYRKLVLEKQFQADLDSVIENLSKSN